MTPARLESEERELKCHTEEFVHSGPFARDVAHTFSVLAWPSGHAYATTTIYLSGKAATPGSSMPARNSSDAPPPVEMCEI